MIFNLLGKINLKRSFYYTWKKIKKSKKNNEFKISALRWNEDLPNGSNYASNIQDYLDYIFKKALRKDL